MNNQMPTILNSIAIILVGIAFLLHLFGHTKEASSEEILYLELTREQIEQIVKEKSFEGGVGGKETVWAEIYTTEDYSAEGQGGKTGLHPEPEGAVLIKY